MVNRAYVQDALDAGGGILRLEPCWVPRTFMQPGRRLRLHPDDLYALGAHRGGINERWFSSTTNADNGPGTPADEGLSYVRLDSGDRVQLKAAVDVAGDLLLGSEVMQKEGGWNVLCKFFDNMGPIPHHMHQSDAHAKLVGRKGKPEAYYFPPQYNQLDNNFPYTFMGLEPGTTKDDVRRCLENWAQGDNGILNLSKAYRLQVGTGWQIDPGILHAPGSLVTYEPQVNSDVFGMFQSLVEGRVVPWDLLVKDVPADKHRDLDFIIGMLDWEANVNPTFGARNRVFPKAVRPVAESEADGYREQWVCYGTGWYSAKELTVLPRRASSDQGQRRLRPDRGAGGRHVRRSSRLGADDDPLRRHDTGRAVRIGGGREGRSQDRESERQRSAGDPETLWPRQPRQRTVARAACPVR